MPVTGWTGEGPGAETPATPTVSLLLSARAERGPVDPLERARLAADKPGDDDPFDADEHAANLLARGYAPGRVSDLARRYAETMADLETERDKLARTARRQERNAREHAAGRITAFDIAGMGDADEGDAHRAGQLERRADALQRELAGAQQAMISPRQADPLEAAASRAHAAFAAATQAKLAAAARPGPRPFASASRGGFAVRSEPVTCPECIAAGATPEESVLLHLDPQPAELTEADLADLAESGRETGTPYRPAGEGAERGERLPHRFDASGHEIIRAPGYDDDGRLGNYQPFAYR